MLPHYCLTCKVSSEKSEMILIGFPLNVLVPCFLACFNILSLHLFEGSLITMCLGKGLLRSNLLSVLFPCWILLAFMSPKFGKFSSTISFNTSCNLVSLSSPSGIPIILILDFLIVSFISFTEFLAQIRLSSRYFICCVFWTWISSISEFFSSAMFILFN